MAAPAYSPDQPTVAAEKFSLRPKNGSTFGSAKRWWDEIRRCLVHVAWRPDEVVHDVVARLLAAFLYALEHIRGRLFIEAYVDVSTHHDERDGCKACHADPLIEPAQDDGIRK